MTKERETDKTDRQTEETETGTEQRIQSGLGRHVLFECKLKLLFSVFVVVLSLIGFSLETEARNCKSKWKLLWHKW